MVGGRLGEQWLGHQGQPLGSFAVGGDQGGRRHRQERLRSHRRLERQR